MNSDAMAQSSAEQAGAKDMQTSEDFRPAAETALDTITEDDPASRILAAASRRFLHYGFGKTTMSEIARDCQMSTGNLYRFFPSKLDIAEAFVRRLRSEHMNLLRGVAEKSGLDAPARLRAFLHLKFRLAYERFHDRPKAFELSAEILRERPEFAHEWEKAEAEAIADILAMGEAEGAFAIPDRLRAARIIQDTVFRFTSPAVFHEGDAVALKEELDEIVDLILDAFALRLQRTSTA